MEAGDRVKQCGFAAAGGADHDGNFAGRHIEGAVINREDTSTEHAVHLDCVNDSDTARAD